MTGAHARDDTFILPPFTITLRPVTDVERDLPQRALAALLWIAAFCFATGIFLSSTLLLRGIPPTAHVAVGRVTIENASKTRDYATAGLFFAMVPLRLRREGQREVAGLAGVARKRRAAAEPRLAALRRAVLPGAVSLRDD